MEHSSLVTYPTYLCGDFGSYISPIDRHDGGRLQLLAFLNGRLDRPHGDPTDDVGGNQLPTVAAGCDVVDRVGCLGSALGPPKLTVENPPVLHLRVVSAEDNPALDRPEHDGAVRVNPGTRHLHSEGHRAGLRREQPPVVVEAGLQLGVAAHAVEVGRWVEVWLHQPNLIHRREDQR